VHRVYVPVFMRHSVGCVDQLAVLSMKSSISRDSLQQLWRVSCLDGPMSGTS